MANTAQVGVWSEIGKLRRVLVCPPGLAHDRLTPDTAEDLLYDDVLWVQQARRDHFDFVAKMEDRGVEVLELDELLEDVVADSAARGWLLDRKITPEQVGAGIAKEVRPWLDEMAAKELAQLLIGGIPFHEVPREVAGPFTAAFGETSHTGFVTAAAQHPVHARQLVMDLQRCHAEPDVLAGPPPGDTADHRGVQVPSGLRRRGLPGLAGTPTVNRATTGR